MDDVRDEETNWVKDENYKYRCVSHFPPAPHNRRKDFNILNGTNPYIPAGIMLADRLVFRVSQRTAE